MPEHDTVVGMSGHTELPGPGRDPVPYVISERDQHHLIQGDPAATSRRYFLETKSTNLADIVPRTAPENPVPVVE